RRSASLGRTPHWTPWHTRPPSTDSDESIPATQAADSRDRHRAKRDNDPSRNRSRREGDQASELHAARAMTNVDGYSNDEAHTPIRRRAGITALTKTRHRVRPTGNPSNRD